MSTRHPDLAAQTVRGVIWAMAGTLGAKLLSLAALVALARLLAPAEFGLFAFALLYLTYLETMSDLGTAAAVVYWPERTEDAAQVAFVLNLAMGAGLTAATVLGAPTIARFFRDPSAAPVLAALAWSLLLRSWGTTHDALLRKDLRFRARLVPELGLAGIKAAIAVALARAGFGVWSLVWAHLAGQLVWVGLLWLVVPWRPSARWPARVARPMLAYSSGIVAVNVLAAVTHHADAVVVARMLGAGALGVYQLAYRLPEMLIALVVWQAGRVLFPAFAKVRAGHGDLSAAYETSLRYLSLIVLPPAAVLCVMAEPLVLTLFGETWRAAIPILRLLSIHAAVRALGSPTGDVLKAAGRPALLALVGALKALVLLPALIFAARFSAVAVALALTLVSFVTLGFNLALIHRMGANVSRAVGALRGAVLVSGIVAVLLAAWLVVAPRSTGVVAVVTAGAVAAGAYLLGLHAVCPELWPHLRRMIRSTGPVNAEGIPRRVLEATR